MLFADIVATSASVAQTSGRNAKRDAVAELLVRLTDSEIEPAIGFLVGEPRQGRIGVGWQTIAGAKVPPASEPSVAVAEVDALISELAVTAGAGSVARKRTLLRDVLARTTADEAAFVVQLVSGGLRQGALEGVMADAVATASAIPAAVVRRAIMLGGRLDAVARIALTDGRAGVEAVTLLVGRPVQPMLASAAPSVTDALRDLGEAAVEWKLDGIRIQVHRSGEDVTVYTRNLNDISARSPEVIDIVRSMPATNLILDGEVLVVDRHTGQPFAFADSARKARSPDGVVRPAFFDVLHADGRDLIDEPLAVRRQVLADVTGEWAIPGAVTDDADVGEAVLESALAAGHEGVVVKGVQSRYEAGRRGKAWRKVKPVHTLDLVVLAVEWGHGRRTGWLSNLHLGARSASEAASEGSEEFVMVGKTFKGLTDDLLRWQTERFLALAEREELWGGPQTGVVWVRPEQVVEIAVDGVARSTRYPGGVALRFARVVRYRPDKPPTEADTIATVAALVAP